MQITSKCTNCKKSFEGDDSDIGQKAECSGCGTTFIITKEEPVVQIRPPASAEQESTGTSKEVKEQFDATEPSTNLTAQRKSAPSQSQQRLSKVIQQYIPKNTFVDYLTFKAMVAPIVLQIMFWLVVSAILLSFVFSLIPTSPGAGGIPVSPLMRILQTVSEIPDWFIFILKVIGIAMTIFFLRLLTEVLILVFKIFDVLKEIKAEIQKQR